MDKETITKSVNKIRQVSEETRVQLEQLHTTLRENKVLYTSNSHKNCGGLLVHPIQDHGEADTEMYICTACWKEGRGDLVPVQNDFVFAFDDERISGTHTA